MNIYSTTDYSNPVDIDKLKQPSVAVMQPSVAVTQPSAADHQPKPMPRKNKPTSLKRNNLPAAPVPPPEAIYTEPLPKDQRTKSTKSTDTPTKQDSTGPRKPPRVNQGIVQQRQSQIMQKLDPNKDQRSSEIRWESNDIYGKPDGKPE